VHPPLVLVADDGVRFRFTGTSCITVLIVRVASPRTPPWNCHRPMRVLPMDKLPSPPPDCFAGSREDRRDRRRDSPRFGKIFWVAFEQRSERSLSGTGIGPRLPPHGNAARNLAAEAGSGAFSWSPFGTAAVLVALT